MSKPAFPPLPPLPIDPVLPALLEALDRRGTAVLQAPPGAGKTTRVPLALLEAAWLKGRKILVLEPRRLAARAAARRMASMLGEAVGETVGYRVRLDTKIGPKTRIEVVTDGLFLRQLQEDPELPAVGAVLFDEFHERGIDSDLALALVQEARGALRDDLRLVVMSATLDAAPVATLLADAQGPAAMVTSEGRAYPVETRHLDAPAPTGRMDGTRIEDAVAAAVRRALREEPGNALVFLPGVGEIRRVQSLLDQSDLGPNTVIAPLYGDLSAEAQDRAISPTPPGQRKIVLATSIAETSLTIEGIRIVVDSGLMRVPRFDPRGGMTRLATVKVSQASAEQRRGRAGRLEPGVCYRLWPEATHKALAPFTTPEIADADLAPLALELAVWGVSDPASLSWLDQPPAAAMAQARELLTSLGALDKAGAITPHGRRMAGFGVHPRLAHMMLAGKAMGQGALACLVAALLGERDIVRSQPGFRDADLRLRVDLLRGEERGGQGAARGLSVDRGGAQQAVKQARQWRRQLGVRDDDAMDSNAVGILLALAYPDRIGQRRPGGQPGGVAAQYRLSGGRGAYFQQAEPLSAEEWLAIADLDGAARESRIFLAAPVTLADLEESFADDIRTETIVAWDAREQTVLARRRRMLFALILKDEKLAKPPTDAMTAAMIEGIRALGPSCLPWTDELRKWRTRVMFLRSREGDAYGWPDLSDTALMDGLEEWLAPFLDGVSRRAHLERIDLSSALRALLPWELKTRLDAEAPTHVEVPSGSRIPIDYDGEEPVLAVRLQEMFGLAETPRIAGGRVPLLLHLLSPARRPVQVTRDLASFWANAYKAVKADLKGQYPKHYWPDNPLEAEPTARAKPRGR
ncbi:ATP-dependent helicase HrpB [Azospirillum lipoferum]|uniref:ATP-dependent helicase HrpB n=1 Tax=Azospirillum lipoferum TaxID=193 RepID=A0A5A9GG49_AZOLI|nr:MULTISPECIES: ATP-dependent helicase HrpB [Azospirillum]KAA0592269.1 ATP-dependent helicase HrpB [Azospirillum lipoferum]MCP1612241.1 ATP-dependent helicase HrpB [Azospirillum lipoferum]MDW5536537.1 ATP-dependent helicase HrpB [Azospirillum sp. NL1]